MNSNDLRKAIKAGDADAVIATLKAAGTFNPRFKEGWTPLHLAVKAGKQVIVSALLDAGAEVNPLTEMLRTPFDVAVQEGLDAIAKLLQKQGGKTAPALSLHAAALAGDLNWTKKHVKSGADVNKLSDHALPLCLALERHRWDVATFLLKKCDVLKCQKWGVTPLHVAARAGADQKLLEKMLKLGARIDAADDSGGTPLCWAAEAGHTLVVDFLIDHGADVTVGHEKGQTPVYCALRGNHVELASHLIDRGGKSTLHQAVQCNHLVRARQKLNAGADANNEEDPHRGENPLGMAIWLDSTEMAELLMEFGADPNQQGRSFTDEHRMFGGSTSLHDAVYKGSAKMVKLLLAHGADPDIADASGMSPIELAKRKDRTHLAHLMEAHIDKQLSLKAAQVGVEQLYTVNRVAELLSVEDSFVMELIKTRKLTAVKLNEQTLRIPAGSIQRYLARLVP